MNNEVSKIFPSERVIEAFELYSMTKDHIRTLITDQYYGQVLHAKKYKNDKILSVNLPRCW